MQNDKTKMDGVEAAPTAEEVGSLLEKRKQAEVPSEVIQGEPRKKSTATKKAKTTSPAEKKSPEGVESSTPQGSNTVHSVVPIAERRQ